MMILDFAGCWIIEKVCKYFFAELEPKGMITRGRERREKRRLEEEKTKQASAEATSVEAVDRKTQ